MISIASDASDANGDQTPSPNPSPTPAQKRRVYAHELKPRAWNAALTARVQVVCQGRSNGQVGRLTDTHPETARRYLNGQSAPTSCFLAALCEVFGLSAEWMLHGRGDQFRSDPSKTPAPSLKEELRIVDDGLHPDERHIERMEPASRDNGHGPVVSRLAPVGSSVEVEKRPA